MAQQDGGRVEHFDRVMGSLVGLPDVTKTAPTTVRAMTPLIGAAQTFIIQTFRQKEVGDTIFLEYVDESGSKRIVIPANVAKVIARQRDALTDKSRRAGAIAATATRKARGIVPGFMRAKR